MKNKKKTGLIIFFIVCIFVIAVCLVIQFVVKQDTKELEKESEKLSVTMTYTKSGAEVDTEYSRFDDSNFYLKIPKSFTQLDDTAIAAKYNGEVPDFVFSNDDTTINVAISMTDNSLSNNQISDYKTQMESLLADSSQILNSDFYEVDGHNVGKIKLISNAEDTDIYNNMIFFSYNEKLVIATFNCTAQLQDEWQDVGDFIIDSLFFNE